MIDDDIYAPVGPPDCCHCHASMSSTTMPGVWHCDGCGITYSTRRLTINELQRVAEERPAFP